MRQVLVLATFLLFSSACTSGLAPQSPAAKGPVSANSSGSVVELAGARGLAFAQAHCSICHAVTAGRSSPNAEVPAFEAVVNTQGLAVATLKPWLRDSHNFPAMMNFAIDPDQIDDLAAYMMTLKRPDYVPPI